MSVRERSKRRDEIIHGDARQMDMISDNSVALVVTSPPYFVGKEYETALGEGAVPATYLAYLKLLRDVFAECARVLARTRAHSAKTSRRSLR